MDSTKEQPKSWRLVEPTKEREADILSDFEGIIDQMKNMISENYWNNTFSRLAEVTITRLWEDFDIKMTFSDSYLPKQILLTLRKPPKL